MVLNGSTRIQPLVKVTCYGLHPPSLECRLVEAYQVGGCRSSERSPVAEAFDLVQDGAALCRPRHGTYMRKTEMGLQAQGTSHLLLHTDDVLVDASRLHLTWQADMLATMLWSGTPQHLLR